VTRIRWDNETLFALCLVTGKNPDGLQETVKRLVVQAGVDLYGGGVKR
jgi:hypothetical protein